MNFVSRKGDVCDVADKLPEKDVEAIFGAGALLDLYGMPSIARVGEAREAAVLEG